ncbi:MAG TPA: prolyl oligopeptidase family serine peptidase [Gemmataceae bacterium]|nr:prolyl oligopeptidase family serine peptidase [Gemmataceae bacterium]
MAGRGGWRSGILAWVAMAAFCEPTVLFAQAKKPPETPVEKVKEVLHGVALVDTYRWLEDQNSPRTRAWIAAQNAYTQSVLKNGPERAALTQRLDALLKVDVQSLPIKRNGRYFFSKRLVSQDQAVLYVRDGMEGKDEVLVDPLGMSPDHTVSVAIMTVSDDGKLLAYGVRQGGEDEMAVRFLDVETKKELKDGLPKARYFGISIKPDKTGFYFTRFEKAGPRVYYHQMGTEPSGDKKLFGDGYGPEKIISSSLSEDGRYLLLTVSYGSAANKTEIYFQDVAAGGPIVALVNDIEARFNAQIAGDTAFMLTNWQAGNGRVLAVDLKHPAKQNWKEIVPVGKSALTGFSLVGGMLALDYLENVASRVKLMDANGKHLRDLDLPGLGATTSLSGRWTDKEAFYSFTSFVTPPTIYRYDTQQGTTSVWFKPNTPIDASAIAVDQVFYPSKDHTKIPMFLVHRKDMKLDGSNPTLLTGYGGFNLSRTPAYSALATVWVEKGGIYALANMRGGGEFGEDWHRAGMLEKKQNVFDDFIAAAEYLLQNKYTSPNRLAIQGRSNGGLLVGAALTQRPDLFQAVICGFPLLDMVRYHKFLIARFWVPEYGSADDPKQFPYIYAYSPYHRVKQGVHYPAVMFVSGDADTRVDPLHARKMAALLQASTASDRPILLHYDVKGGHSGGEPVSKQIEDAVDDLTFLFGQLGVK